MRVPREVEKFDVNQPISSRVEDVYFGFHNQLRPTRGLALVDLPQFLKLSQVLAWFDLSARRGLPVWAVSVRYYELLLKHPAYKLFVDKISVLKTTKKVFVKARFINIMLIIRKYLIIEAQWHNTMTSIQCVLELRYLQPVCHDWAFT